jgi:hypothetical protein
MTIYVIFYPTEARAFPLFGWKPADLPADTV